MICRYAKMKTNNLVEASWLLVLTNACSEISISCCCVLFRREKYLKHLFAKLGINYCVFLSVVSSLGSKQWEVHFPTDSLGCKPHCSYCWKKKKWKRKETIKIRYWASFEVLRHNGRFLCWEADFPNATKLDRYHAFLSRRQWKWPSWIKEQIRNMLWERPGGGQQMPRLSLKTNRLSGERALPYPTAFFL